jgi:hypothetical protein
MEGGGGLWESLEGERHKSVCWVGDLSYSAYGEW